MRKRFNAERLRTAWESWLSHSSRSYWPPTPEWIHLRGGPFDGRHVRVLVSDLSIQVGQGGTMYRRRIGTDKTHGCGLPLFSTQGGPKWLSRRDGWIQAHLVGGPYDGRHMRVLSWDRNLMFADGTVYSRRRGREEAHGCGLVRFQMANPVQTALIRRATALQPVGPYGLSNCLPSASERGFRDWPDVT
jgi:hypothetical protein